MVALQNIRIYYNVLVKIRIKVKIMRYFSIYYTCSSIRAGSSISSLIVFKNLTEVAPSIIR